MVVPVSSMATHQWWPLPASIPTHEQGTCVVMCISSDSDSVPSRPKDTPPSAPQTAADSETYRHRVQAATRFAGRVLRTKRHANAMLANPDLQIFPGKGMTCVLDPMRAACRLRSEEDSTRRTADLDDCRPNCVSTSRGPTATSDRSSSRSSGSDHSSTTRWLPPSDTPANSGEYDGRGDPLAHGFTSTATLTHLGEQGASLLMLMAKSRYKKPENIRRYFKPSPEAIAEFTQPARPR